MKSMFSVLFFGLLPVLLSSPYLLAQADAITHFNEMKPQITGRLTGYDPVEDAALVLKFVCVVPTPEGQEIHSVRPEADGSFSFQPTYPLRYQQIWFSIGSYYYGELVVDRKLVITADLPALKANKQIFSSESVRFEGPDGPLCHFVNDYNIFQKQHRPARDPKMEMMMDRSLPADEKAQRLKEFQVQQAALEKTFLEEHPADFAWVLENERLSNYYGELFVIHWGREMPADLYREALIHQPLLASNAGMLHYYAYLSTYLFGLNDQEELEVFQGALLPVITIPEEAARLRALIDLQQQKVEGLPYDEALYRREFSYFIRQYEKEIYGAKVDAFIEQTTALPAEKGDMVKLVGGGEDIWQREQYVGKVLPTVRQAWCADLLRRDWEATREQLAAARKRLAAIRIETAPSTLGTKVGALPNGAELYQAGDPPLDTFLSALRAAHPGKALLLDIWAPWCGPCLYDMQNSAANLQKLREMDVEVVYLCVADGTNPEIWQQKVAELDLFAPQVFLGPELSTAIMRFFDLQGYPSHVFLDKSGQYHPGLVHSISRIDFGTLEEKL